VKPGVPSWKLRRRAVFTSLIFGMLIVSYVAIQGRDSGLNETLALGGFGLIGAVVAAYIGGAAYEDVRLHAPKRRSRYDESEIDMEDEDVH
jgi:hypothetical protein